ncbi:MAG TPA: pitrilysin family protein [Myxococcota bacterium]|jgi:zinc protease
MRALLVLVAAAQLASCAGTPAEDPRAAAREPFAWELAPAVAAERPIIDPARLHRATLANGLQVVVLEDHRLPRVSAGFIALRGAAIETPEEAGLAAFTATAMERGAGERGALALAAAIEDLGADFDVASDWDTLRAGVSGLSRDSDALFAVLADVVRRPRFDAADAKRAVAEQRAALAQAKDDPAALAGQNFARTLYGAHRLGTPGAGTDASVARFTPASARAFHARVVTPAAAILWAVGDVEAADFLARAERDFGDMRGNPPAALPAAPSVPTQRRVVIVDRPDLEQAQIAIGHEGIARTDERRLEVQLLNTAFGSGAFSSRLMARIRAIEGLTYGISAQFAQNRLPGPFVVSSFTRVPEVGKLLASAFEELERVRTEPPAGEELEAARQLRIGGYPLALETTDAVMAALLDLDVYGLPRDTLDTYRSRVRAITAEQVAAAARALIHPERATIVVVGPADALREPLSKYGAVEVVEP